MIVVLVLIGFLGGLVSGISPCILPVLPVIFAAGAASGLREDESPPVRSDPDVGTVSPALVVAGVGSGSPHGVRAGVADTGPDEPGPGAVGADQPADPAGSEDLQLELRRRRRPFAVVAGLVLSFSVFTLIGSWLLSALGLPQDVLRWIGLVVLGVVGLGLIVPPLGDLLEVPFARLSRGGQRTEGGGFVLGLSLGLVFVPCAGPVLAAITVVSATHRFGFSAFVLTAAFALGVAVPLLVFAVLGQRLTGRMRLVRSQAAMVRRIVGVVLVVTALVIALNLTDGLQRAVPGYTDALQSHIEGNASAKTGTGRRDREQTPMPSGRLHPGESDAAAVRAGPGHPWDHPVVEHPGRQAAVDRRAEGPGGAGRLLDVLVHQLPALPSPCRGVEPGLCADGLTVIGVHTPEFAFEHVVSNVTQAAKQLGVCLSDRHRQQLRHLERLRERVLAGRVPDRRHRARSARRLRRGELRPDRDLHPPASGGGQPEGGTPPAHRRRRRHPDRADHARVLPRVSAPPESGRPDGRRGPDVHLPGPGLDPRRRVRLRRPVVDRQRERHRRCRRHPVAQLRGPGRLPGARGSGTVTVSVNGIASRTVTVSGEPRLYQLVGSDSYEQGLLSLAVSPGVQAYDFTFG